MGKNQITKLKNLLLNSIDLCKIGANQKAHICLTKSLDNEKEKEELQILKNMALSVSKALGIKQSDKNISKMTNAITESLIQSEEEKIKKSMIESIESIMKDTNVTDEQKTKILEKSVSEFFTTIYDFTNESTCDIQKSDNANTSLNKTIGDDKNMIDVNKMAPEDKNTYENLMKKYSGETEQIQNDNIINNDTSELNPEVKKALDEVQKAKSELEELKKSYEIKELEMLTKKYEILGQKVEELAPKLYEYKKSGGTIYNDYTALLDEQLKMTENLGIFKEIGSNREGNHSINKQLEQKIQELMKADTSITHEQAFVKACDENIELRKAFDYK